MRSVKAFDKYFRREEMGESISIKSDESGLDIQARSHGRVYESLLDTIGATPLVKLPKLVAEEKLQATIIAKLESFNPLASVKDRIAYSMINDAEQSGKITPGKTVIVEPTSGNTGIGLAFIAASKGYRIILTMPESMSIERRKMLAHLGAEIVLTPKEGGMKGAIDKAAELASEIEDSFIPGQFVNPANPKIHSQTTAQEILQDTQGEVDIFISGVGTGGTLTGCAQVFKTLERDIQIIAVEPEGSPVLSGEEPGPHMIQGIGAGFIPDILDTDLIDDVVKVSNDQAFETARLVAKLEGLPIGISSGAALHAAIQVAKRPENAGKNIVVILPSFAERYLSTALFDYSE